MNFVKLSEVFAKEDDEWVYTEEPHISRRQAILKKYPEIKKLMGYDPMLAVWVTIEVIIQLVACYAISIYDPSWLVVTLAAYFFGGYLNHSLGAAIHEIGHNLAFGHNRPLANRALGMWANLPMGIPLSVTYKKYHSDHHKFLGQDPLDVDIPMKWETILFRNPLTKTIWLIIQPLLQAIRPFIKSPKPLWLLEYVNTVVQLSFDVAIFYVFGTKAIVYLVGGSLLALGLHPMAGHFYTEHYMFDKGQATHSYYGPLNFLTYNLGYHNEHHDFPYIPGSRLPEVRRIAPEFYDNIPHHTSWVKVLWDFIWMSDMGPAGHGVGYRYDDIKEVKRTNLVSSLASNGIVNSKLQKEE